MLLDLVEVAKSHTGVNLAIAFAQVLKALSNPLSSELRSELDRFLSTDPEQVTDVCQWWYDRRGLYPRLYRMALDYLTIPGVYYVTFNRTIRLTQYVYSYFR
jgi:hypothetical protein